MKWGDVVRGREQVYVYVEYRGLVSEGHTRLNGLCRWKGGEYGFQEGRKRDGVDENKMERKV
jgi:hypothetical protein